jgi:hypothetical protein
MLGLLMLAHDEGIRSIGKAALGLSALLIIFMWWVQSGVRLRVHADGVVREGRFGRRGLLWSDLASYRATLFDQSMQAAGHAGGLIGVLILAAVRAASQKGNAAKLLAVALVGKDGTRVKVGSQFARSETLLDALATTASAHLYPSALAQYEAAQPVWFGKRLCVQKGTGITTLRSFGRRKTIPFLEVERSGFEGASFVVRQKGRRTAWFRLPSAAVDSPLVAEQIILRASAAAEATGAGMIPVARVVER